MEGGGQLPSPLWIGGRVVARCCRIVRHVRDLIEGAQMRFWVSVTVETPAHAERLGLVDRFHVVNAAMTARAVMCARGRLSIVYRPNSGTHNRAETKHYAQHR